MQCNWPVVALTALIVSVPVGWTMAADGPMTNADIVRLTAAGVGEPVIVAMIESSETEFDTDADSVVELAEAEVGDAVIAAMVAAATPSADAAPPRQQASAPAPGVRGDAGHAAAQPRAIAGSSFRESLRSGGEGPELTAQDDAGDTTPAGAEDHVRPEGHSRPKSPGYSNCASFLDTRHELDDGTISRYRYILGGGRLVTNRLYWLPFRLSDDGEIVPNPDRVAGVKHTSNRSGDSVIHVFEYPRPSLWDLSSSTMKGIETRAHTEDGVVTVTLQPDMIEVYEDLNLGDEERSGHYGSPHNQDFVISGTRFILEVKDGECIPMEISAILTAKEDPTRKTEVVFFYAPLCSEIEDYLEHEPELHAVFDANHVDSIVAIFAKHGSRFTEPREGFELFTTRKENDVIWGKYLRESEGNAFRWFPKFQTMEGLISAYRLTDYQRRALASSPAIAAYKALANCEAHGWRGVDSL